MFQKLFPGGKPKALTLSYDDGVGQDMRLMDILRAHGIACTFNVNGGMMTGETHMNQTTPVRRLTEDEVRAGYAGFELALHGYRHLSLTAVTPDVAAQDIVLDRLALENIAGRPVRGMAYAYGSCSPEIAQRLRALGVVYARTTKSTRAFSLPEDFSMWNPTCHHNDEALDTLCDAFLELKPRFDTPVFYLWGHSYEFDLRDNWARIELFAARMGGKQDIWYATNGEIYTYTRAMKSLVSSCDGRFLYNPSAVSVWGDAAGRLVEVLPGETKEL